MMLRCKEKGVKIVYLNKLKDVAAIYWEEKVCSVFVASIGKLSFGFDLLSLICVLDIQMETLSRQLDTWVWIVEKRFRLKI